MALQEASFAQHFIHFQLEGERKLGVTRRSACCRSHLGGKCKVVYVVRDFMHMRQARLEGQPRNPGSKPFSYLGRAQLFRASKPSGRQTISGSYTIQSILALLGHRPAQIVLNCIQPRLFSLSPPVTALQWVFVSESNQLSLTQLPLSCPPPLSAS